MINTKASFDWMISFVVLMFTTYPIIKDLFPNMDATMVVFLAGTFDVSVLYFFSWYLVKLKKKERKKLNENERL